MDYQQIIETVTAVFTGCDERNWKQVQNAFAPEVLLDYSSLSGSPAVNLPAETIINSWKAFFAGFPHTHHQLGNFNVKQQGDAADVFCYGTATHYLPNETNKNVWTVVGTYNFHCVKINNQWKVDEMKFNFKYQDGNTDIPALASEKAKQLSSDN